MANIPPRQIKWYRVINGKKVYTLIPVRNDYYGNTPHWTLPNNFIIPMQTQEVDGVTYKWAYGYWTSNPPNTKMKVNQISLKSENNQTYFFGGGNNYSTWAAFYRPMWFLNGVSIQGNYLRDIGSTSSIGVSAYNAVINGVQGIMFTATFVPPSNHPEYDYDNWGSYHALWFFSDSWFRDAFTDNYNNSDPVGDSGGNGYGIPAGDAMQPDTTKPSIFPFGAGMHIYSITEAQYASFINILWGRDASAFQTGGIWHRWENYKFNPIAGVLSVHHVPLELIPATGSAAPISIAGVDLPDIQPLVVTSQWVRHDFPAVDFPEPIGYFADYAGVTAKITLPFCGVVSVSPSAFIGGSLQITYWCDIVTGNVAAAVVATDRDGIAQLVAEATGNCAYVVPVTGNDNGMTEIVGTFKSMINSALTANPLGLTSAGINLALGAEQHHTNIAGSLTGNVGYAATQRIVVEIEYPVNLQSAREYNAIVGRPSEYADTIGNFSGYTEFEIDGVEIAGATDFEKSEIERLLRGGIIV